MTRTFWFEFRPCFEGLTFKIEVSLGFQVCVYHIFFRAYLDTMIWARKLGKDVFFVTKNRTFPPALVPKNYEILWQPGFIGMDFC